MNRRLIERLIAEGLVVAALLGWWAMAAGLPDYILPDPWQVAVVTLSLFTDPDLLDDTLVSTARVLAGVALALLLGFVLALLPWRWPVLDAIVHDRIRPLLNSFPSVGWAILAVIWFGTSNTSVIFVQVAILTPFCLVNLSEGLKELDTELLEMGRSFSRGRVRVFVRIVLPLLLPYIVAALRIAYGVGWKIALVSELFGASSGLGYLMLNAQIISDAATVFATCFAIVAIFVAGEKLVLDPLARRVGRT